MEFVKQPLFVPFQKSEGLIKMTLGVNVNLVDFYSNNELKLLKKANHLRLQNSSKRFESITKNIWNGVMALGC